MTTPAQRPARPIRSFFKQMPMYSAFKQAGHYPDFWWWKLRGEPRRIPHLLKQRAVVEYGKAYQLTTLIETGTYYGEMIAAVAPLFSKIYSIELDAQLAAKAKERFRKNSHVEIIAGDSQTVVPDLLRGMQQRCLWWLDAGYCGWVGQVGNPNRIGAELNAILSDRIPDHIILMDDADGLNGEGGAPTLQDLVTSIQLSYPKRQVEVARNIIRITPKKHSL